MANRIVAKLIAATIVLFLPTRIDFNLVGIDKIGPSILGLMFYNSPGRKTRRIYEKKKDERNGSAGWNLMQSGL